jgi:NADH dehydrogenase
MKRTVQADTCSAEQSASANQRILILGGGFAGACTARQLEKRLTGVPGVEIVLIARENFVLFTPMLHEVAGSDVSVTDVVQPLRKMLRRTRLLVVEIEAIDLVHKQVRLRHPDLGGVFEMSYDQLVLALGAVTNFYRTPGAQEYALTMKTLGDAIRLRNRVIELLDVADNLPDAAERRTMLTAVVAGGGFAGVETVGAINDLLRESIKFYPGLKEEMIRLVLVEAGDAILPELSESLGRYAQEQLRWRGVEVRLKTKVTGYDGRVVSLDDTTKITTHMLVWTAGITPSPLLSSLPCRTERGHVLVDEHMRAPGWSDVWALGDCALVPDLTNPGKFCPPTAQHATRQATVLADNIVAALRGCPLRPFRFKIIGLLATVGRRTGVAEILGVRFSGLVAWFLWRGIYLAKLPGLGNKVRVAIDWMLDLILSKDIVQLPTLPAPSISEPELLARAADEFTPVEHSGKRV